MALCAFFLSFCFVVVSLECRTLLPGNEGDPVIALARSAVCRDTPKMSPSFVYIIAHGHSS